MTLKKIIIACWGILPLRAVAQQSVAFAIDSVPTTRAELSARYQEALKTETLSAEQFQERYILYKLKAIDARHLRYDTLGLFRWYKQTLTDRAMREQAERSSEGIQVLAERQRARTQRLGRNRAFRIEQITLAVPQWASTSVFNAEGARLQAVYADLLKGTSFQEAERKANIVHKDIAPTLADGTVEEVSLLPEFVAQLDKLKVGEVSAPFSTYWGWHVVRLLAVSAEPTSASGALPATFWKSTALTDAETARVEEEALVKIWEQRHIVPVAEKPTQKELQRYWDEHRERYEWKSPRFVGGVIHAVDKKTAKNVKKMLKNVPLEQWETLLNKAKESDATLRASVETGVFKVGDNVYVDHLAFKGKHLPLPAMGEQNVHVAVGKVHKRRPKNFREDLSVIERDYLASTSTSAARELQKKYSVKRYP